MSIKIDARFLHPKQQKKFDRRWKNDVAEWYSRVLEAFHMKNDLKYIPTVYVVPFYPYSLTPIDEHHKYRQSFVGMTAPDPTDPENTNSIFLVYNVIKRAPEAINMANLAHELGHVYSTMKGTNVKPEELLLHQGESSVEIDQVKETPVRHIEESFDEPVKSMILKLEKEKSQNPGVVRHYLGDSPPLLKDKFLETVLGKERAEDLVNKKTREAMRRVGLE